MVDYRITIYCLNTQQGKNIPADWCELPVVMTRNKLIGSTAGGHSPNAACGVTHSDHPTHI